MKKLFVETNADNAVLFVDAQERAYLVFDSCIYWENYHKDLTLEAARNEDYSNLDGCETADECKCAQGIDRDIFDFNEDDYENVTEF